MSTKEIILGKVRASVDESGTGIFSFHNSPGRDTLSWTSHRETQVTLIRDSH